MTTPQVIAGTVDSYTDPTHPNANYGQDAHLRIGSTRESYVYFSVPIPQGAPTLQQAILDLNITGDGFGVSTTIEIAVITASWKERTITHATKPTVGAVQSFSFSGAKGDTKTFDVTTMLSAVFGTGATFYGLRIRRTAGGGAGNQQFGSAENANNKYRPLLRVTWAQKPDAPTNLNPDDLLSIQTATPKLTWNFGQQQIDLDAFQVQVSTVNTFASLVHDSGWVISEETQYLLPVTLTAGTTYYWRVRLRSALNVIGNYSGVADFKYTALPTLTVTAPSSVGDTDTPLVQWTFAGQQSARVALLKKDQKTLLYRSAPLTATQFEIPRGTKKTPWIDEDDYPYFIRVRAWDAVDRTATPGFPAYREVVIPYTWRKVGSAVAAPTALNYRIELGYRVVLTWTRATTCDKYMVMQNGKTLDIIDSGNVAIGGTSYEWPRYDLSGKRNVVVKAGVVQANGTVNWSPAATVLLNWCPVGVWVYDLDASTPAAPIAVQVMVEAGGLTMNRTSDRELHLPLGREDPVVFQTSMRGWEGEVNGLVLTAADRDKLIGIIRRNIFDGNEVQVMTPDLNLQCDLGDPTVTAIQPAGQYQCAFPFVQSAGPWNW